jgi:hypothetical protein
MLTETKGDINMLERENREKVFRSILGRLCISCALLLLLGSQDVATKTDKSGNFVCMKPVIKTFTIFIAQGLHKYKEGDLVGRLTEYIRRQGCRQWRRPREDLL